MPRKAGSIADTSLSLHARSRTRLHQTSRSHTSFSEVWCALGDIHPFALGSFPVSRLPLGRAA